MLRKLKHLCWTACLLAAVQSASAFSFYGTREPYQILSLGYLPTSTYAVHNLGEEYRWNIPTLYYSYDQTFLDYFGTNGTAAADEAFNILTTTLTNVSSFSPGLDEIPLESRQLNYTASALQLFDLKSFTLQTMLGELCLADSIAYTWTLRVRALPSGASCPAYVYDVIQRNFDPVSFDPSAYVNGILYTYWIDEMCPTPDEGITVPTPIDPDALTFAPVARHHDFYSGNNASLFDYFGYYYTGLTRDDVGGMRYLLNTNNLILENAGSGTVSFTSVESTTNQLLYTSNLTLFAEQALTNSDAALAALYPGLFFTLPATNFPVLVTNAIVTSNLFKSPYSPYTNAPIVVYSTNYSLAVQLDFVHYFANLWVVQFKNGAWTNFPVTTLDAFVGPQIATLQTVSINPTNIPYGAYQTPAMLTNVTSQTFVTNGLPVGEFFVLTSNLCNMTILANELTETEPETNVLIGFTNVITYTNSTSSTNTTGGAGTGTTVTNIYAQNLVTYFTNHVFLAAPVTCAGQSTNIALRQGINYMEFHRRDYDSLLNRFWEPVTNVFRAIAVTNNNLYPIIISRIVTAPDIILSAADLTTGPTAYPIFDIDVSFTSIQFDTNGIVQNSGNPIYGPGTVAMAPQGAPTVALAFNKVGPSLVNIGPISVDQTTAGQSFIWGSFDGTTNPPVIYPVGSSLNNFVDQTILEAFPATLPAGTVGTPYAFSYLNPASGVTYNNTFSGAGGLPPYSFTVATGSTLPPGLVLANGVLSGTPLAQGAYSFTIQMTDASQRFINTPYSLTINP